MCPMLINSTESSRIDSELRDWFHAPSPSSVHIPIFNSAKSDVEVKHESPSKHELAKVCRKIIPLIFPFVWQNHAILNFKCLLGNTSLEWNEQHSLQEILANSTEFSSSKHSSAIHIEKWNSNLRGSPRSIPFCSLFWSYPAQRRYFLRRLFLRWSPSVTCHRTQQYSSTTHVPAPSCHAS